jgi:hypothetical protein
MYDKAFRRWSEAVQSGRADVWTEMEYRRCRNALADLMLDNLFSTMAAKQPLGCQPASQPAPPGGNDRVAAD